MRGRVAGCGVLERVVGGNASKPCTGEHVQGPEARRARVQGPAERSAWLKQSKQEGRRSEMRSGGSQGPGGAGEGRP